VCVNMESLPQLAVLALHKGFAKGDDSRWSGSRQVESF
jgi:hypothetical protein